MINENEVTEAEYESTKFERADLEDGGKVGAVIKRAAKELKDLGVGAVSLHLAFECDDGRIRTAETFMHSNRMCVAALYADKLKSAAGIINEDSQVFDQLDVEDRGILERANEALDKKQTAAREAAQREARESLMALLNLGAEGREAPGVSGPQAGEA